MHKNLLTAIAPLLLTIAPIQQAFSAPASTEIVEDKPVGNITIDVETLPRSTPFNPDRIFSRMRTKIGDPFSQLSFDQDLKALSDEYARVEPIVEVQHGEVFITLKLWQKPVIRSIKWYGNEHIKTKKLQKELGIKPYTTFNRVDFNKAFNKVREYYIKKGYFESQLHYTLIPEDNNQIDVEITVNEGHSGHIRKIVFNGFTKAEERHLLTLINTKKYNFFTSWLTGTGNYQEEVLENDQLLIVNFLQNQGYADARVKIELHEAQDGRIIITIHADKGKIYHFGEITYSGNTLYTEKQVEGAMLIHEGEKYSPDRLRDTVQSLKDLFGKDGYIEANVRYQLQLAPNKRVYNVHFTIEEGKQFKVGLVRVMGNVQTNTSVILHESLLTPGETFDSRRLKATQQRLEAIGYFKSVNVYPVRAADDRALGPEYRDVIIEVEETTTGNVSFFFGASSVDSFFGGLNISENNFNYRGLGRVWKDGPSAVRGGGEFLSARISPGKKQSNYYMSWMTPYWNDTLWRIGFDISYSQSSVQSSDYDVRSIGGSIFGSYPLTQFWTQGWRYRLRNGDIDIKKRAGKEALAQENNSGIVTGLAYLLNYDSTDRIYKPHRGIRSAFEAEIAGVMRRTDSQSDFPMLKLTSNNTFYYAIWRHGIFKARMDVNFLVPFGGNGKPNFVPLNERFFVGGETSVRGYKAYRIGPQFKAGDPTGGISSSIFSVEYLQEVLPVLDLFAFFDSGSVSLERFSIRRVKMSYGVGTRIDIGNRMPLMLGVGFPINPDNSKQVERFFFSMGGQF